MFKCKIILMEKENYRMNRYCKYIINVLLLCSGCTIPAFGQSKPYVTSGAEFIFSFADINSSTGNGNTILRFAPVINLQSMLNKDVSTHFGLFTGLAIRNVGYRM